MTKAFAVLLIALTACASVPAALDEEALIAEAEAADIAAMRAQSAGDLETFANYLSEDYAYIDISGNRVDKAQVLARRAEDKRSVISETPSEDEAIVLAPGVVMFRGRTDTLANYYGGLPRPGSGRWSVVWRKEADGQWRMVAAQATDRIKREYPVKVKSEVAAEVLDLYAGTYVLETGTPLTLVLEAEAGRLLATIEGQFEDMEFLPENATRFFATARPFELVLAEDACSLVIVTFGAETKGVRVVD
ncbi:MAG: nuclear transport factor 2 family protein [Hyphomonas sp.]|nr:nuclear transport factor 2 family protein [Hyphomonas sp.]